MRTRQQGFTYLGLIIILAIIGLVGAATLKVEALLRRAAAEKELLVVGAAFSAALGSYAAATPKGQLPCPPALNDLLRDPRFPDVRRHLRKIFVDPLTGRAEWGVEYAKGTTCVVAVYSLSNAKALKIANFESGVQGLDNKVHISDWRFAASGTLLQLIDRHSPEPSIIEIGGDKEAPPQPQGAEQSAPSDSSEIVNSAAEGHADA